MTYSLAGRWPAQGKMAQRILRFLACLLASVVEAQNMARERRRLANLSDAALRDVGLTRADIESELRKPRWRR